MTLPAGPRLAATLQTLRWAARPEQFLLAMRSRFGDTFTLRLGGVGTYVVISDPEDIKTVFSADPAVLQGGAGNVQVRAGFGDARVLMLLDGDEHLARRKVLGASFHGSRLAQWEGVMAEVAERELASWPARSPLASQRAMQRLTLDIILRVAFGLDPGPRLAEVRGAVKSLTVAASNPLLLLPGMRRDRGPRSPWAVFEARRRLLADLLIEEMRDRRSSGDGRDDVLGTLLRATGADGASLPDDEIANELIAVLGAGHETTATTLAWAFAHFSRTPDAYARLREESQGGETAFADAAVREVLRLHPPLAIVSRQVSTPVVIRDNEIRPGVMVSPCAWLVHRRPELYPSPEEFRPERFLGRLPSNSTWLPYGGGTRRCIGASFANLEMRTILQTAARTLDLSPVGRRAEPARRRAIFLVPARGGRVHARAIHSSPQRRA